MSFDTLLYAEPVLDDGTGMTLAGELHINDEIFLLLALLATVTTPEIAPHDKFHSPEYAYHARTPLLPVDQLNMLLLLRLLLPLPLPDYYYMKRDDEEEPTINPRQLLAPGRLAQLMSLPQLTTFFQQHERPAVVPRLPNQGRAAAEKVYRTPKFNFKMNDECYNAILHWLNLLDAAALDVDDDDVMGNPTGILNGYKRRNSLQTAPSYQKLHDVYEDDDDDLDAALFAGQRKRRKLLLELGGVAEIRSSASAAVPTLFREPATNSGHNPLGAAHPPHVAAPPSPNLSYHGDALGSGPSANHPALSGLHPHATNTGGATTGHTTGGRALGSHPHSPPPSPRPRTARTTKANSFSGSASIPVIPNANGAFPCTECDKQFKRSEHLKRHIRSVHSNIRPFHCKYCEKKFSRSDNLAQHLKTHYRVDSQGQTTIMYGSQTKRRE